MEMESETEWKDTYEILRQKHEEAQHSVTLAKKCDEQGNDEVVLIKYIVAIAAIDDALATPVALPDDPNDVDDTWHSAVDIVQMLKRTRGEVMHRIATLSPSTSQSNDAQCDRESSPASTGNAKRPRTFSELATELKNLKIDFDDANNLPNVLELLFACHGIKLYRVKANGEVTTTDESSTLRIVRLDQNVTQNLDATYFMQIIPSSAAEHFNDGEDIESSSGNANDNDKTKSNDENQPVLEKNRGSTPPQKIDTSLIYPLVPGVSPCFRTDFGAFIFPDIQSNVQGAAIGMVVPHPADQIVLEILDSILHGIVRQKIARPEEGAASEDRSGDYKYASDRISENIVNGACLISNGLVKGTEQVSKLVSYTTPYLLSKMNKAPDDAPPVSNKVANGIEIAKTATGVAVGITSFVAAKVGSATMALGHFLAPHVHAQGSKLLSKSMGYSTDEAKDKMSGVLTVAAGAVEGFGTVYTGLEQSAGILGRNLSDNSVKIIEHKYGTQAGTLANDTFDTVGNMINLSRNMSIITPKGLAKKTVKGAGKAMVGDFKPRNPHTNYAPAGTLYPDLTEFSKKLSQPNL